LQTGATSGTIVGTSEAFTVGVATAATLGVPADSTTTSSYFTSGTATFTTGVSTIAVGIWVTFASSALGEGSIDALKGEAGVKD